MVFQKDNAKVAVLPDFERHLRSASFDVHDISRHTDELMARRDINAALRKRLGKFRAVKSPSGKNFILAPSSILSASNEHKLLSYLHRRGVPVLRSVGYCDISGADFVISELHTGFKTAKEYLHAIGSHGNQTAKRLALLRLFGLAVGKLHQAGLGHDDLHLENVLVKANRRGFPTKLLLADFRSLIPNGGLHPLKLDERLDDLTYIFGVAKDSGNRFSNQEQLHFLHAYNSRLAKQLATRLQSHAEQRT